MWGGRLGDAGRREVAPCPGCETLLIGDGPPGASCTLPRIIAFDEQRAVLSCWGDEDRSTQGRRRGAISRAQRSTDNVAVDLRGLTFADASLMLDLVMLARRLRCTGGELRLWRPQPQIERLIELVGLSRLEGVRLEPAPVPA